MWKINVYGLAGDANLHSEAMNYNKYSLCVFFDISKAFDTVNHTLRINKLEHYGIRGIAKQWFIDYLNNRKQYVSLKEVISLCMNITTTGLNTWSYTISPLPQRLS